MFLSFYLDITLQLSTENYLEQPWYWSIKLLASLNSSGNEPSLWPLGRPILFLNAFNGLVNIYSWNCFKCCAKLTQCRQSFPWLSWKLDGYIWKFKKYLGYVVSFNFLCVSQIRSCFVFYKAHYYMAWVCSRYNGHFGWPAKAKQKARRSIRWTSVLYGKISNLGIAVLTSLSRGQ